MIEGIDVFGTVAAVVVGALATIVVGVGVQLLLAGRIRPDLPCRCATPSPWLVADHNSYRRWCGTCGGRVVKLRWPDSDPSMPKW
jgi:hypothetical protein